MHIAVLACRKCNNGNFHSAVRLFMFLNTISCVCKNFMFGVGGCPRNPVSNLSILERATRKAPSGDEERENEEACGDNEEPEKIGCAIVSSESCHRTLLLFSSAMFDIGAFPRQLN